MLTEIQAAGVRIRGVSVGGIYTSLHVPELSALFDVGIPSRSSSAVNNLFLSHGHVDHCGALSAMLGARALIGKKSLPRTFLPAEILEPVTESLRVMSSLQRWKLAIDPVAMEPGDEATLKGDRIVRAFRTYHPVPSLGYLVFRRVAKLKPEHADLSGSDIARRRRAGDDSLFDTREQYDLAYATDTLIEVVDQEPALRSARVLILECTFLDERKSLADARAGCHIHLDEILERADVFDNEALVLMHFSQIYKPSEVVEILDRRCPPRLRRRIVPFVPQSDDWPG